MCKAVENLVKRGEARGKCETMLATAKRMLRDGILALNDIARYSGLTLAQVKKLQAEAQRFGECSATDLLKSKVALPVFLYTLQV